jgi:phage tail-like protein
MAKPSPMEKKSYEFLTACRFYLELSLDGSKDPIDAIFFECKGLKATQQVIEICEVTPNKWGNASKGQVVRTKVPGNTKYDNIILRRGMSSSMTFWNWFEYSQGGGWADGGQHPKQRKNGSLTIFNQSGEAAARLQFKRAWPTIFKVSDVSAKSTEFEIEELGIAVEELIRDKV